MGKKKNFTPMRKKNTLAQRMENSKKVKSTIDEMMQNQIKARLRLGWAFIISMAETEGVELTPEQLKAVTDNMDANLDEYDKIKERDGEEVADAKMYQRVCEVLGEDPSDCDFQSEKIFDPDTIEKNTAALNAQLGTSEG